MDAPASNSWRERHPFTVGAAIVAKPNAELGGYDAVLEAGRSYRVRMRGEDAHGLWVAVDGILAHLPVHLFMGEESGES